MAQTANYLESLMLDEDREKLAKFREDYRVASAAGDARAMAQANADAQNLKLRYGMSGGVEEVADIDPTAQGTAGKYDSALKDKTDSLKANIDAELSEAEKRREEIPVIYREEQDRLAGLNAQQTHNVNETAVASGLGSGVRTQQAIAMSNIYQSNSAQLGREMAAKLSELEDSKLKLIVDYRTAVANAIARNESEKAAALYEEYQQLQKQNAAAAKTQVDAMLKIGVNPPENLVSLTGYSKEYINSMLAHYAQTAKPASSGGSYSGSSGASGASGAVIGSDAWCAELYGTYGADAENYIKYYYTRLGLKAGNVGDALAAYQAWLSKRNTAAAASAAQSAPSFSNIMRTVQGYLQTKNYSKAQSTAAAYFSTMTSNQKTEISRLLTRYGLEL